MKRKFLVTVVLACVLLMLHISPLNAQWIQTNGPYGGTVECFAASGTNLFAGTMFGGVFLSTNNGTSWTAVNSGFTNTSISIYALAVSGTNLFAGTWGGGVFLSTNNGTSWTAVNSGLTNPIVHTLAVSGTNLFAGTYGGGVFLSTNNGTSWTVVSSGMTSTYVYALAVSGTNLFAGPDGSGVWRRPLSELFTSITSNEAPSESILKQNYPNPFNSTTTIKFHIATSKFVKLSVFDMRGFEVATLVNEQLKSGTHEVVWDGSVYSSGIYNYKLTAGDYVETKKMILMK